MRHQKNSGNKRVRQQKKQPNKPSSMRDYNPRRQERYSVNIKGKQGEQNPLEGLEAEKELIITRREELSEENSESYPLWETTSLADEVEDSLDEEESFEEESSETSSEEPHFTEPLLAKDAKFSSPEENDNTPSTLNTEETDVIDAPVFSQTKAPLSSSEEKIPQTAQNYAENTSKLSPQETPFSLSAPIKGPTSDKTSFKKEISEEPDIYSKTTAKMIQDPETSSPQIEVPKTSFTLEVFPENTTKKAVESPQMDTMQKTSPKTISPSNSPSEENSLEEISTSSQITETTPFSSEVSVPEKFCYSVSLEELTKNHLSPGTNPSKQNRHRLEKEPHTSSSSTTVSTEKEEDGVVSFRPSSQKTETIAAKLANIAMEEEENTTFGEGLGIFQPKTPEKIVSGQMRPLKKTKKISSEEEESAPFGLGLVPPSNETVQQPKEVVPPTKSFVPPSKNITPPREVVPPTKSFVPPSKNVASQAKETVSPPKIGIQQIRDVTPPSKNEVPQPKSLVQQFKEMVQQSKLQPKEIKRDINPPPVNRFVKEKEEEDEDEDEFTSSVSFDPDEEDDGIPYDMNSLVNSLDKGGEDKFRAFQKRKLRGTSNGDINSHPGVVRAYSSEYLDEQTQTRENKNIPTTTDITPADITPDPQEAEKSSKPFNRDYNRREDRNRSKDPDRNRKNYRSNYNSSNETKPKEENLVLDRSDSQNRFDPKKGKPYNRFAPKERELDTQTSTPFREEKKFSREERLAVSSNAYSYGKPLSPSPALFVMDLNNSDARRWLFIFLFLIVAALFLNAAGNFWPAENYRSNYLAAEQCIDYRDWDMAQEKLRQVVRQEPSHTKARLALAYVELRKMEENSSQGSIQAIAQDIQLIRNILDKKFPGQRINDLPGSIEDKFLQLVYTRLYRLWKQNTTTLEQDPHFQILSKLWPKETEQWNKSIQRIQIVSQAITKYIQIKQEISGQFTLKTLLTEIDPDTQKPYLFLSSELPANELLLDGWGHPLHFKIESLETPEEKPRQEFALKMKSLGADGNEDNESSARKGWPSDIEKNYPLSILKKK